MATEATKSLKTKVHSYDLATVGVRRVQAPILIGQSNYHQTDVPPHPTSIFSVAVGRTLWGRVRPSLPTSVVHQLKRVSSACAQSSGFVQHSRPTRSTGAHSCPVFSGYRGRERYSAGVAYREVREQGSGREIRDCVRGRGGAP